MDNIFFNSYGVNFRDNMSFKVDQCVINLHYEMHITSCNMQSWTWSCKNIQVILSSLEIIKLSSKYLRFSYFSCLCVPNKYVYFWMWSKLRTLRQYTLAKKVGVILGSLILAQLHNNLINTIVMCSKQKDLY